MIRQNKDIKGIKIHELEHRLAQYADDTQLMLDANELSLQAAFKTLNTFYNISGLKVNTEKTKAVWIGSRMGSSIKLCKDTQLDWDSDTFIILGITFSAHVDDLWTLNFPKKI